MSHHTNQSNQINYNTTAHTSNHIGQSPLLLNNLLKIDNSASDMKIVYVFLIIICKHPLERQ